MSINQPVRILSFLSALLFASMFATSAQAVRLNDKGYLEASFDNRSEGAIDGY
jgi:hypothetical protein